MEYYSGRLILGGIFMRHYDVYFDKQNSKIHFTRSKCNTEDHITVFEHYQNPNEPKVRKNYEQPSGKETINPKKGSEQPESSIVLIPSEKSTTATTQVPRESN
jgi:hypothetical protein